LDRGRNSRQESGRNEVVRVGNLRGEGEKKIKALNRPLGRGV